VREPTTAIGRFDDVSERRQANRAVGVSAIGLALTGLIELGIALFTGSVGLLGDALHNLSDVSTSAVVFLGFRISRRAPSDRYPYGFERAEDGTVNLLKLSGGTGMVGRVGPQDPFRPLWPCR
jgi:Co/Zn/Cd efflux system component